MKVRVHYWHQLREARGVDEESLQLDQGATVADLLDQVSQPTELRSLMYDHQGQLAPWILIDHDGKMIRDTSLPLSDGDEIRLLSHISGG